MKDISSNCCISISCYRGDLYLLKGCLNSIRRYIPDIPIVLFKHGIFPTDRLCDTYGVKVIEQADVNPQLQKYSYGYGLTKMVAFWHSPFDRFIHVDPDAICWGNILDGLPWDGYDLIYNEPHEVITPFIQRTQYFDPDLAFSEISPFPWQGQPYFNTGMFAAKRGIFDIDEYLEVLKVKNAVPNSFFADQGPLNFMAFRKIANGQLKARDWPFQAVVPVISASELSRRFRVKNGEPIISPDDRRLIHWAGQKPLVTRPSKFDMPMEHFRLQHFTRTRPWARPFGRVALVLEELNTRFTAHHHGSFIRAAWAKSRHLLRLH